MSKITFIDLVRLSDSITTTNSCSSIDVIAILLPYKVMSAPNSLLSGSQRTSCWGGAVNMAGKFKISFSAR